jgi:Tfp pilus assembly protein PilN
MLSRYDFQNRLNEVHIPFYHRVGHGLYITDDALYWAELHRTGQEVTVAQVEQVTTAERATEERLQTLVDRIEPEPRVVATHLAPTHVRCMVAERRSDEHQERWMRETARSHLPAGASLEDFVLRGRAMGEPQDRSRSGHSTEYLLALARRSAVEARRALCEEVGLTPVVIGDLRTDFCFAFSFDSEFVEGRQSAVLMHSNRAWLLSHENGILREAPHPLGTQEDGAIETALVRVADDRPEDPPSHLLTAGPGAHNSVERIGQTKSVGVTPYVRGPQFGSEDGLPSGDDRRAAAAPAVAYGVKALYVDSDTINFLDEETTRAAQDEKDRHEAVRVGLLLGGGLALLLFLATVLNMYLERQLTQTSVTLERLDQRLAQVEAARQTRNRLQERLRKSQSLVRERTRAAVVMDQVGEAVPKGIWFDEMKIRRFETDSVRVQVTGYAVQDADVATLLGRLEQRSQSRQVRLQYSKILPAETVSQRTDSYRQVLSRFEIRFAEVSSTVTVTPKRPQ